MNLVYCTGQTSYAQRSIDKVATGTSTTMQAYTAAHSAERDCRKASAELAATDKAPFADKSWNRIFEQAVQACRAATRSGTTAMTTAKEVLDGNSSLAKAQLYKDARNALAGKIWECKLPLSGLAEAAGVPKSQVDFLNSNVLY